MSGYDVFGEPPSHSQPLGGIEEFDDLMFSSDAEESRKQTLLALQSATQNISQDIVSQEL